MRKYSLFAAAIAFVFAMAIIVETAHAQTGGGTSAGTTGAGTQTSGGSAGTGTSSTQSGSSGSDQSMSGQSTSGMDHQASGKEKSEEGCVIRQQSDYFLVSKKGNGLVRLSGGQDLASHVGHHVKLHGTEQKGSGSMASSSATGGGTSGTAASSGAPGSAETTNPAGSTGSSTTMAGGTQTGSSTSGSSATGTAEKTMTVDRVDMISEACPANIQKNAPAGSIPSGTNNPPQ
ncbi:MAG TPA: hypothetical protein VN622_07035 [Clostridia bacterium]|nr:hypothetical protein [Clostridia bacterium]